jgi:NitT/TauT family transport system permease protein
MGEKRTAAFIVWNRRPQPSSTEAQSVPVRDKTAFIDDRPQPYLSWMAFAVLLGIWEAAGRLSLVSPLFLPAPSDILMEGWELVISGQLFRHLGISLFRIGSGFILAAGLGIPVGILLGSSRLAEAMGNPILAALFPIPKIAILPLLILWLGIGEAPKIAVIGLGVFFPMTINVYTGVKNVDPLLIRVALSLGSSRLGLIKKVVWPSILPMILAGMKLGLGISLLLVVAAEMIAADAGIGFLILTAADLMQTKRLMVGIGMLSGLGLLANWLLGKMERRLIPWKEGT